MVLILEKVPRTLRGELSRWMVEPRTGVFVGQVSAMVRDRLWDLAVKGARGGGVILLHTSNANEQGFAVRVQGATQRDVRDWEGLALVHIPSKAPPKPRAKKAPAGADGEPPAPAGIPASSAEQWPVPEAAPVAPDESAAPPTYPFE